jgi:hypothetical protein
VNEFNPLTAGPDLRKWIVYLCPVCGGTMTDPVMSSTTREHMHEHGFERYQLTQIWPPVVLEPPRRSREGDS